ncbi:MAG: hypothetical protein RLZZ214_123 [Verrucomicrobiota bacterium]|jgi:hypothetical protein
MSILHTAAAVIVVLGLAGCTVGKIATPAPTSPFLAVTGADTSARKARLPFDHSWRSPTADAVGYKNIVVRPVTTKWLRSEQWGDSVSEFMPDRKQYVKQCGILARYWTTSLKKAFSSPVCSYYITDSTSQPGTLILEVALTEVNFGGPPAGVGSMAFEARVKDAATGKYIAIAADRRATISKIAKLDRSTFTRANQELIDEWSQQLMEASNKELFPTVGSSVFSPF